MRRTFADSSVLITAFRGAVAERERALNILEDPARLFIASSFLYLEVVPKTIFYGRDLEYAFYEKFLESSALGSRSRWNRVGGVWLPQRVGGFQGDECECTGDEVHDRARCPGSAKGEHTHRLFPGFPADEQC